MRTLVDQLSHYAAYHRDARNVATHFVGVPMIMVAVAILLSRPAVQGLLPLGIALSPALGVVLMTGLYYLLLDLRLGAVMAVVLAAALWAGQQAAALDTPAWLGWGLGLFVVGWVIQFVGHAFEGRKPAFVDDIVGLFIGPLFLVAEVAFALGLRADVRQQVAERLSPAASRHKPATATA